MHKEYKVFRLKFSFISVDIAISVYVENPAVKLLVKCPNFIDRLKYQLQPIHLSQPPTFRPVPKGQQNHIVDIQNLFTRRKNSNKELNQTTHIFKIINDDTVHQNHLFCKVLLSKPTAKIQKRFLRFLAIISILAGHLPHNSNPKHK